MTNGTPVQAPRLEGERANNWLQFSRLEQQRKQWGSWGSFAVTGGHLAVAIAASLAVVDPASLHHRLQWLPPTLLSAGANAAPMAAWWVWWGTVLAMGYHVYCHVYLGTGLDPFVASIELLWAEAKVVGYGAVLWWGLATSFETKAAIAVPWLGELFYEPHARFVTLCWVAAILVAGRVGWAFVQRSLRHWNRDADFNREVERRGIQRSDWQKGKRELGVDPHSRSRSAGEPRPPHRGFRRHVPLSPKSPRVPRAATFRGGGDYGGGGAGNGSGGYGSPGFTSHGHHQHPGGGIGSPGGSGLRPGTTPTSPTTPGLYGSPRTRGGYGRQGLPGSAGGLPHGVTPIGSPQSPTALGRVSNQHEAEVYFNTLLRYNDQQQRNRETVQIAAQYNTSVSPYDTTAYPYHHGSQTPATKAYHSGKWKTESHLKVWETEFRMTRLQLEDATRNLREWLSTTVLREAATLIWQTDKILKDAGLSMTVANDPIADICGAVAAREADLLRPADHNQAMAKRWVIEASRLAHKLKDYLEVASKSTQAYVASRIRTLADDRFLRRYQYNGGEDRDEAGVMKRRRKEDPTDAKIVMHCFRCFMNDRLYRETSVQAQTHLQAMYYDTRAARPSFDALHWVTREEARELDKVPQKRGVESSMYIYEVESVADGSAAQSQFPGLATLNRWTGQGPRDSVITYQLAQWRRNTADTRRHKASSAKPSTELYTLDIPPDRLNLFHTIAFFLSEALHRDPVDGKLDGYAAVGVGRTGLNLAKALGLPPDVGQRPHRPIPSALLTDAFGAPLSETQTR